MLLRDARHEKWFEDNHQQDPLTYKRKMGKSLKQKELSLKFKKVFFKRDPVTGTIGPLALILITPWLRKIGLP